MLAVGIVDQHHREAQRTGPVHRLQTENAGGSLLAASDYTGNQMTELCVHQIDKVSTVINYQIRPLLKHFSYMGFIFFRSGAIPGEYIEPPVHEGGRNIVLCGKRVAARDIHLRSTGGQSLAQVCRLGFQMHGKGDFQPLERLLLRKFALQSVQKRHMVPHPVNLEPSLRPQFGISYFTCHDVLIILPTANLESCRDLSKFLEKYRPGKIYKKKGGPLCHC